MKRRTFLQQSALAGAGVCALSLLGRTARAAGSASKPNLLLIFPDQWRSQAFSWQGDPNVRTPNLDRLAAASCVFSRTYANHPVCSPTRSTLQTGQYTHQTGFIRNNFYLEQDPQNLGYRLKEAGYRTGYIGKWHIDGHERPGFVPPERRQGWDDFHGFNRGHWYRLGSKDDAQARYYTPDGKLIFSDIYEPILQTDLAIDFLHRQTPGTPWALAVSYGPPHDPYTPPASHARRGADIQWRPNVPEAKRQDPAAQRDIQGYYGLCELMDDEIGRLLRHLDESGFADNTIVVFTSDHGDMQGSQGRHAKLVPYEESASIPFYVRGPGIAGGRQIDTPVSTVDFAPTLLGLCGASPSPKMAGRNLAEGIRGKATIPAAPVLLEGFMDREEHQWRSIVHGPYKLTIVAEEHPGPGTYNLTNQLYDLSADPYEMKNLYHDPAYQEIVAELTALRETTARRTGDAFPKLTPGAPENPAS